MYVKHQIQGHEVKSVESFGKVEETQCKIYAIPKT
jgi:hypothetical protein